MGYYSYLPAISIYEDVNYGYFDKIHVEKYGDKPEKYAYRLGVDGRITNKYFCGVAVMQAPFFLIAHGLSKAMGYEADGFSKLYIIFICIAAIFYFCLGLFFLDKILAGYSIYNFNRILTILAVAFATHAFFYSVEEVGMSHIYSFALIAAFIYYVQKYFHAQSLQTLPILAFLCGLIALVRPPNLLVILILPFAAGSLDNLGSGLRKFLTKPILLIGCLIIFLAIPALQLGYYKISTGHFIVDTYHGESFNFLKPHMLNILFSYKKGLFLYTPLLLISLAGLYFMWKRNKYEAISLSVFLLVLTYVLSCWWNWWYGDSFSSRVYVEYIPLFAILLAIALQDSKKPKFKKIYISLIVGCFVLNQVQTYQYRYEIIHWDDMTKKKYWDVFLELP